jgi:hypothetical protein
MSNSPRSAVGKVSGPSVSKASSDKSASYAVAVKRGILKNSGDTKMAQAAPPGSAQANASKIAQKVFYYNTEKLGRKNSTSGIVDPEVRQGLTRRDPTPKELKKQRKMRTDAVSVFVESNKDTSLMPQKKGKSVSFNEAVTVIEYEVNHYNDFVPTKGSTQSQSTKYLQRADEVTKCLSSIIQFKDLNDDDNINEEIERVITENIASKPDLFLRKSISVQIGEDPCNAILSGPNLNDLDEYYYKPVEKVTFLDYAIAGAVQQYKNSPYLTKIIKGILNYIINPIRQRLGIGGQRTRRNKRSKKSKHRKSKKSNKKTKRRNSSR